MIWFKEFTPADFIPYSTGTLMESLGIEITEIGDDFIAGTMPVDNRTIQPMGILHGGANVALAETLGSIASGMVINKEKYYTVGLDINANHIRPVSKGLVRGVAKPLHIGGKTHVWEIKIFDTKTTKLTCISRLTMAILAK
jgi:1,4-dihydroxy-2-naphthoyl-CoA hydrolase